MINKIENSRITRGFNNKIRFQKNYLGNNFSMRLVFEGEKLTGKGAEEILEIVDKSFMEVQSLEDFKRIVSQIRYYFRNFSYYRVNLGFKNPQGEKLYIGIKNNALVKVYASLFLTDEKTSKYILNYDIREGVSFSSSVPSLVEYQKIDFSWLKDYEEIKLSRAMKNLLHVYKLFYDKSLDPFDSNLDFKINIMAFILESYGNIHLSETFNYYLYDGTIEVVGLPKQNELALYGYFENYEIELGYSSSIENKIRAIGKIIRDNLNPDNIDNLNHLGQYLYYLKHQEEFSSDLEVKDFVKKIASSIINLDN